MNDLIQMKYIVGSIVYSLLGIVVYVSCIVVFDLLTPKISFWKELVEKQNIAFAIFAAAFTIGITSIIASAIHG